MGLSSFSPVVINGDSRQLYNCLPLLTAQPSQDMRADISHKLYGILSPSSPLITTVSWKQHVTKAIDEALSLHQMPWVVGGSGFYLKTLITGLSPIAPLEQALQEEINHRYASYSLCALQKELSRHDPQAPPGLDRYRVMRGLIVYHGTQKPLFSFWHRQPPPPSSYCFYKIYLNPLPLILKGAVEKRFYSMIQKGVVEEVAGFLRAYPHNHLLKKTIGFPAIEAFLKGNGSYASMVSLFITHTHQYIKRQRTWFAHQYTPHLSLDRPGALKEGVAALESVIPCNTA